MHNITVLYLIHRFTFGGTEKVIVNLVNNSSPYIHNIICSFCDHDSEFVEELYPLRRHVISLNKKQGNDLSIPFKIASICHKQNIHIIHALGWATYAEGIFAAKFLRKLKFIFSFRGKTIEDTFKIPKRRIYAQKLFAYLCDVIITPSENLKKEYAHMIGINEKKIKVIYNGIDIDKFNFHKSDVRNSKRKEFGLKMEDIVIGSVARFDPVKNLTALIFAFSKVKKNISDKCKLLLIGDGPEMPKIKKMIKNLDLTKDVILPGMRKDIPECLNTMDIYAQPSRSEGVPNSILEAMASGLPVIATNVGGVPEIVLHDKTGILIDWHNQTALIKAIEYLIKNHNKRKEMGKLGRERVLSKFSIQKMVSEYENLYKDLIFGLKV